MNDEKSKTDLNAELAKVHIEINGLFGKLAAEVEKQVKRNATEIDVLKIVNSVGIKLDEAALLELKIDRIIFVIPWVHWCCWFPWRPIWCWWWNKYYPWYRCCPYWWHSCHWTPMHH